MFDKNWNIIIAVLIIVLIIFYFRNCYEGFAGNTEAIANVASLYNEDNMTVTNLNVTGDAKFTKRSEEASDGIEFLHTNLTQGIGLGYNTIYATGSSPDVPLGLTAKGNGKISLKGNTDINGNANVTGTINSPTINTINAKIAALEGELDYLKKNSVKYEDTVSVASANRGGALITDCTHPNGCGVRNADAGGPWIIRKI